MFPPDISIGRNPISFFFPATEEPFLGEGTEGRDGSNSIQSEHKVCGALKILVKCMVSYFGTATEDCLAAGGLLDKGKFLDAALMAVSGRQDVTQA